MLKTSQFCNSSLTSDAMILQRSFLEVKAEILVFAM